MKTEIEACFRFTFSFRLVHNFRVRYFHSSVCLVNLQFPRFIVDISVLKAFAPQGGIEGI